MNFAHLHLLLNHFPIIGMILGFGLFIFALIRNSDELKRASLVVFALIALLTIPTFLSGTGAAAAIDKSPGVSESMIEKHQSAAMLAFFFIEITGAVALIGLWQFRGTTRSARWTMPAILLLSLVTVGLMARTGNLGGEIRHPEVQSSQEATGPEAIADATIGRFEPSPTRFSLLMTINKWWWAFMMDLHFIGLTLLIGTIGLLDLRLLGFAKQLPVAPLHKLVPWGLAGFAINLVTGVLCFTGMSLDYTYDVAFWLKMLAIVLAGGNLLLYYGTSVFRRCEALGPGEDAPPFAKFLAGSSLFLWFAVLILGRYIQFLQGTISP